MGVSRVDFAGETLVDLTGDTVTPQSLLRGYSAHNRAGELIEGLLTIPTVGNGTVTIKQNGVSKGTFSMNQSGNTTIELTDNNTTYNPATQSANGLMTAADKKKLDGLTPTTSLAVTQQGTSVLDGTVGKMLNDKGKQISVYKGEDGNLHFRDWAGADSVIPFNVKKDFTMTLHPNIQLVTSGSLRGSIPVDIIIRVENGIPSITLSGTSILIYGSNSASLAGVLVKSFSYL